MLGCKRHSQDASYLNIAETTPKVGLLGEKKSTDVNELTVPFDER